jgi:hypothetical protein
MTLQDNITIKKNNCLNTLLRTKMKNNSVISGGYICCYKEKIWCRYYTDRHCRSCIVYCNITKDKIHRRCESCTSRFKCYTE